MTETLRGYLDKSNKLAEKVGNTFKEYLSKGNVSIDKLSKKSGYTKEYINDILNGKMPTLLNLVLLANALEVSDKDILALFGREQKSAEDIITEAKIFEDLYYKENSLVGLLQAQVEYLEKEANFLRSKIYFMKKYPNEN